MEVEDVYDLELDKVVGQIKKEGAGKVLIQLPDGLKMHAVEIVDYLEKAVGGEVEFSVWGGSCFGACDVPESDCDLIIQFGHAEWN